MRVSFSSARAFLVNVACSLLVSGVSFDVPSVAVCVTDADGTKLAQLWQFYYIALL